MSSNLSLVLSFLWLFTAPVHEAQASKILAVYAFGGKSHFMMTQTIMKELIQRGHQVTVITAMSMKSLQLGSNYTEILIEPVYDFWSDIKEASGTDNLFELTNMDFFGFIEMLEILGVGVMKHTLNQANVKAIINAKETKGVYDLLLVEQFYQEAFLSLGYIYDIPVVTSSTLGYENHMSQMMGLITPWSFVPHGFLPYTDRMSFMERLKNSFYSLYEDWHRELVYFPKIDRLVHEHFSHLKVKIPKVTEMEKNISVILLNSHAPLTTARPTIGGMIPIGGMHIYPPKALPNDIKRFLDEAKQGVIYFSLGSNIQSKDMPPEMLKIFLEVFADLNQRILWKFESENITDLPSNVMVKKWLPQSDILAHRNVKVFITHGGLFGSQEGVYNAVPMLGIPFYCDQHLNMKKAVQVGYAISLHFQAITKNVLKDSLLQLLENPMYKKNVEKISQIFRDRPMGARESAMYWIEHVIRHKGAPHLRSAGLDLKWYEFYLLDVIGLVAGSLFFVVIILVFLLRKLLLKNTKIIKKNKMH